MRKKFLSLILILSILVPLITNIAYGITYVKRIDVGFSQIQIHVGNKKISRHKEPFIYDESIWVPLTDLARGLNLKYTVEESGRIIKVDSGNRLNTDGPNRNKIESFQLGYEIEAKERIIRDLEGIYKSPQAKALEFRSISVALDEWDIILDGKKLYIDSLFYNDDIYVDIMDISPYLYIIPSYSPDKGILNIDHNNILLKDEHYTSLDSLLTFRRGRNHLLDIQLDQLEKMIALKESLRSTPYEKLNNIKDLEKYLNKYFNKVEDLLVDIETSETIGNWIYIDIYFPTSQNYRWRRLQRKLVEDWIWDMYTAILKLYNEDAMIYGVIRNPYFNRYSDSKYKNYVTFDTREMDLYFDFSRSQLQKDNRFNPLYLTDQLNRTLKKYENINFEYSVSQSGTDIDLFVYPDSNSLYNWNIYVKMGYLKRLNWEVRRLYPDFTINGKIVSPDNSIQAIEFVIDDNKIRSHDLLRETERYLRNIYGSLSYGIYDYSFDFYLYEQDIDNLKLIVEGAFSVGDEKWTNASEITLERINRTVQNAISNIISLWDMNVSTEVMDKNGVIIAELDTYQKNVGIVYASPDEGVIEEGTLVYLYTDTAGADIYYTLDGSTPTRYSLKYTGPILVSRDVTINAFGYKEGMGAGPITTFVYTVIPNESISYGLNNLVVKGGKLNPNFSRDILNYEVFVEEGIDSISLTPYASNGRITIDGTSIQSGNDKVIPLIDGKNQITIGVKEFGKEEKVYTMNIYRESSKKLGIQIEDLHFSTITEGIFKGRLSSKHVSDFSNFTVKLLSKAGVNYASGSTDSNGYFNITFDEIDTMSKIIGYKCEVYDADGNLVLEMDLK